MVAQTQHLTVEEFDKFVMLPENVARLYEYIGGEVIEVVSNSKSSKLGLFIGGKIMAFVIENGLGRVTGADGGYIVAGERYIPDAGFISIQRQPDEPDASYNPLAPDLAVEVLSPGNTPTELRIKMGNYLQAGTTLWVVDPDKQQVEVYVPGQKVKVATINDTLDGGTVLPGFKLPIKDIFSIK
jgi:Uma2 family endonuclease